MKSANVVVAAFAALIFPAVASTSDATVRETIIAEKQITNVPGKRLVSLIVDYPPGLKSPPHRHANSAFIFAYVVSGKIRSKVDDEPVRIYGPGESWFENPGARHRVSDNASDTEPARLLAVFIVDAGAEQMTFPDSE